MPRPLPSSLSRSSEHAWGAGPKAEILVLIFWKGKCKVKRLQADDDGEATGLGEAGRFRLDQGQKLCSVCVSDESLTH